MARTPLRLKLLALAVGIPSERRDELLEAVEPTVLSFSQHGDSEKAASDLAAIGDSGAELLYLASAMDHVLKSRFAVRRRGRATITKWIYRRAVAIRSDRQSDVDGVA